MSDTLLIEQSPSCESTKMQVLVAVHLLDNAIELGNSRGVRVPVCRWTAFTQAGQETVEM